MSAKLRIGVVGYCPPSKFDEDEARRLLNMAFDAVIADHPEATEITVVSGLTNVGVLAIAYDIATNERGWRTAGVCSAKAYDFEWFPVSEEPKIVGENWGEESATFLADIHVLVRIGGGEQSHREAREFPGRTYEYELALLEG